jgi:hypothetical protein
MAENYTSSGSDPIITPFSDDEAVRDDELIVEADKPGDSPEVKAARAQKRRERAQERERERKEQASELAQLKQEIATERAERARLQGFVAALPQAQPENAGKDPYAAALDQVYEKQGEAYNAYQAELKAGTLNETRVKHYERISRDLEEQKGRIHARQVVDADVARQRQEAAQQPYVHKYPDVYNNPQAFEYAKGEFAKRNARSRVTGEQITNESVDEIMEETRTVFKLGKRPAPSRTERDRMSGISSASGGGSSQEAGRGIQKTKELQRMAESLYSDLTPEKAWQKWVDSAGRQLRKDKVL